MNLTTCPFVDLVDLVNEDVRGQLRPGLSAELRTVDVAPRWWAALSSIHASVEGQLAGKRARWESRRTELEIKLMQDQRAFQDTPAEKRARVLQRMIDHQRALAEARGLHHADRVKILEFRSRLEQIMPEARLLRDQSTLGAVQSRCATLEAAIRAHRAGLDVEDTTEQDEALWGVL